MFDGHCDMPCKHRNADDLDLTSGEIPSKELQ